MTATTDFPRAGRREWVGLAVVEGDAVHIRDEARLQEIADAYAAKYEPPFHFTVRDGDFLGDGGRALVFEVRPRKAFGFGKLETFSQTRWRFRS